MHKWLLDFFILQRRFKRLSLINRKSAF